MKKYLFPFLALLLFSLDAFSQKNAIKDYPLNNYIAPEIEYRSLDLGSNLQMLGLSDTTNQNRNSVGANIDLHYYDYFNTVRSQSISDAFLYTSYSGNRRKTDTSKSVQSSLNISFDYFTETRLYGQNGNFWGMHGYTSYRYRPLSVKDDQSDRRYRSHNLTVIPYLSFGKGRVQPIRSARQAMDILISLQKYNRLSINPGKEAIDSLARVANRIRYKRFFDRRFKRIYQLEELDKAIRNMELVDTLDMVYFANLSDIWDFIRRYNRGAGTRTEGGIIPMIVLNNSKTKDIDAGENVLHQNFRYGIYGFVSFNRMKAVSYAWQSDIMVDLTFGYTDYFRNYEDGNGSSRTREDALKAMLNASWQFGYYPTTRTHLGLTPYTAVSFNSETDFSNSKIGMNTGVNLTAYYYISPRFRLSFYSTLSYAYRFDNTVPAPFWNSVLYNRTTVELRGKTNDMVAFPIRAEDDPEYRVVYYFVFSLNYAIF